MNRRLGIPCLILGGIVAVPPAANAQQPATPAEQFQLLVKEYHAASYGAWSAPDEPQRAVHRRNLEQLPRRFLALAEANPADPVAVDVLARTVWAENTTAHPEGGALSAGGKALAILQRDHVRSDRLADGLQWLSSGIRQECEPFLRSVLEHNPHRGVQAVCCLSLAQYLRNRRLRLELLRDQPEQAQRYAGLLEAAYLDMLQQQDAAKVTREIEALYERAIAEFADAKLPWGGTVGARATLDLFELQHLSVGNVAPDIEGEDQDGVQFHLADYRGKVVLLDFWQEH